MGNVYKPLKVRIDNYGRPVVVSNKTIQEFEYLVGLNVNDIILFDNGNDKLRDEGRVILPRHHIIFVGTKDGELQYKPYEFNQYRIVVSTYKDIIVSIDSIG